MFHDYAREIEQMVSPLPGVVDVAHPEQEIERIVSNYQGLGIDGVISTDDYPGSTLASIIAERFGLSGVPPRADLLCQHKYHARIAQLSAVADAVPEFELLETACRPENLRFPVFIKPVKGFFSIGAFRVDDVRELRELSRRATLQEGFFAPFRVLFEKYTGLDFGAGRVLAESLLEGVQATLEGYVRSGTIDVIGIVDSIMFPGTWAFERFQYPSRLPESVQTRMAAIAATLMRSIGFDNGIFNIEFMYNRHRDTIHIIEINPRMACQFSDLYEKVDGLNTYSILLDLALGKQPAIRRRQGKYAMAASCVLRLFEDRLVLKVPTAEDVATVVENHPDVRIEILASEGKRLSQELQDTQSYRYGIISIGGRDLDDILVIFEHCRSGLPFVMEPVGLSRQQGLTSVPAKRASADISRLGF